MNFEIVFCNLPNDNIVFILIQFDRISKAFKNIDNMFKSEKLKSVERSRLVFHTKSKVNSLSISYSLPIQDSFEKIKMQ